MYFQSITIIEKPKLAVSETITASSSSTWHPTFQRDEICSAYIKEINQFGEVIV